MGSCVSSLGLLLLLSFKMSVFTQAVASILVHGFHLYYMTDQDKHLDMRLGTLAVYRSLEEIACQFLGKLQFSYGCAINGGFLNCCYSLLVLCRRKTQSVKGIQVVSVFAD